MLNEEDIDVCCSATMQLNGYEVQGVKVEVSNLIYFLCLNVCMMSLFTEISYTLMV